MKYCHSVNTVGAFPGEFADVVNLHCPSSQSVAASRFLAHCDARATAVAARTRYYPKTRKWGIAVMLACLTNRQLGLLPFDWFMLFTGTMVGGLIVLLY
jgi:hypothetical protein